MNFFMKVDWQSVLVLYSITMFFILLFILVIYLKDRKNSSNSCFFVLIWSIVTILIITVFIFIGNITKNTTHIPFIRSLASFQFSFWIISLFLITQIKYSKIIIINLNMINILLSVYLYYFNRKLALGNALTAVIITTLLIYCLVKLIYYNKENNKFAIKSIMVIIILMILYHTFVSVYRLIENFGSENLNQIAGIVESFLLIKYVLSVVMVFAILYLHSSVLVDTIIELGNYDTLTKTYNRSCFMNLFEQKLLDIKRSENTLVLIMLDLDGFKTINDTYGHIIGDNVLKEFCEYIKSSIRDNDVVGRYGGDEFLLMFECKEPVGIFAMFERILIDMSSRRFSNEKLALTFSCGMVTINCLNEKSAVQLIDIADKKLYEAKENGKNCIMQ